MNYLVGLTADRGGRDALALGRMLARTGDVTLIVCIVLPEVWGHPSLARVDAEYAAFLARYAEDTIAEAREFVGDAVQAEYVSTSARTATEGLITTAPVAVIPGGTDVHLAEDTTVARSCDPER